MVELNHDPLGGTAVDEDFARYLVPFGTAATTSGS
jgi:hypothetical protein